MQNQLHNLKNSDCKDMWIDEIPAHWKVQKLKYLAKINLSNVDKHSKLYQKTIKLCNYVDVYYKEFITPEIDFMQATASNKEIAEFSLTEGDVLITKDSETPQDIGVPAYVPESLDNVICGYHLAQLKPRNIIGKYLFRVFQSELVKSQLFTSANGITRFGISKYDIGNVLLPLPSLLEQQRIADFLDQKTAEIDEAIKKKQRLIELLEERKTILINQIVTKGLNPDVPMKNSGVEWIGEIPEHWLISRLNWLFTEKKEMGFPRLPLLVVSINTGVTLRNLDDENNRQIAEDFNSYKRALIGDISFNKMRMWQGAVGVVPIDGLVSPDYVVARPIVELNSFYYESLFKTEVCRAEFLRKSHGIVMDRNRLYWEDFKAIFVQYPPLQEQNEISKFILNLDKEVNKQIEVLKNEINALNDYKRIIISQAVTGKIII